VIKEGETAPQALTVRVCDGLSCEMAGARDLLAKLPKILGKEVRVVAAPCVGRCEQAPVAVVGQNPVIHATCETVQATVEKKAVEHAPEKITDFAEYQGAGGYELLKNCVSGTRDVESVIKTMEFWSARPGRCRLPVRS
jgi:formate dehydrogenase